MSVISPAERKLIDQAIAEGRVKKVPSGRSGEELYRYDKEKKRLVSNDPDPKATFKKRAFSGSGRKKDPKVTQRRAKVQRLADEGLDAAMIAQTLGVTKHTVLQDAYKLKISLRKTGKAVSEETASQRRARRAENARANIKDQRRFKDNPPPSGKVKIVARRGTKRTLFPTKVAKPTGDDKILKDGRHNSKIGGDVLVGRLKGARIFTLTLEERATCPRACALWLKCYGNNMQHSTRWKHGSKLEKLLPNEVADLCALHQHVIIRLHVLGDFYSVEYVALWAEQLRLHSNLTVFGFTAWTPDTPIGQSIARLRMAQPQRFMIRTSGQCATWGSFTLPFDPGGAKSIGDALICPEQVHAIDAPERQTHCGNCGFCWHSNKPVAFVEH